MKVIYTRFDKHKIADLPRVVFPGRIITINTPGETDKAVDYLLGHDILGVDTETRPTFSKREQNQVCLLQVSTKEVCFLFRLHLTGMTPSIIRLLEDTTVPKIGLSWHDDLTQLHRRIDFKPGYFIELQEMAREVGIKDLSLQKIYANLFREKISKTQRLSNWEASILRDSQKLYAATDAWTCIMIYEEICRLKETRDYELVVVPEPEPRMKKVKVVAEKTEKHEDAKPAEKVVPQEAKPKTTSKKGKGAKKKSKNLTKDPNLPKKFIRKCKIKHYVKQQDAEFLQPTATPRPKEHLPEMAMQQLSKLKIDTLGGEEPMVDFLGNE